MGGLFSCGEIENDQISLSRRIFLFGDSIQYQN